VLARKEPRRVCVLAPSFRTTPASLVDTSHMRGGRRLAPASPSKQSEIHGAAMNRTDEAPPPAGVGELLGSGMIFHGARVLQRPQTAPADGAPPARRLFSSHAPEHGSARRLISIPRNQL